MLCYEMERKCFFNLGIPQTTNLFFPKLGRSLKLRPSFWNKYQPLRQSLKIYASLFAIGIALILLMNFTYHKENDVVWRDYTVQHLVQWYRKEDSVVIKKNIRSLFKTALQDTSSSIAGTALIALDYNIGLTGITTSDVAAQAVQFVHDPGVAAITRTTALQIAARLNQSSILDDARTIALSSNEPVPLRISAIAAVGIIGTEQDLSLLEKYSVSSDIRLRTAAIAAVKKIKRRKNRI